jgi:GNAT superfamily N-acetyltransferase
MSTTLPAAIIDRLCGHAHTEEFDVGEEFAFLDLDLDDYRRRFNDGDETVVFVLLAERSQVIGYVALSDLVIPRADKRYLSVPALAVTTQWRGGNAGARLMAKALSMAHIRNDAHLAQVGRRRYDGMACMPWTEEIEKVLRRQGFIPLPDDVWWIRPFKRS